MKIKDKIVLVQAEQTASEKHFARDLQKKVLRRFSLLTGNLKTQKKLRNRLVEKLLNSMWRTKKIVNLS